MNPITTDKDYISFDIPIRFEGFMAIGYFPYETKRIRGIKISRAAYQEINNTCVKDNKVVVIFKDTINFSTQRFAIFFHDVGAILGKWEDIVKY